MSGTPGAEPQYAQFPYPSRAVGEARLTELARLLWLFARETGYDFAGKTVLDVGTGTGHRVVQAARMFPDARFVAVDTSRPSLEIAEATAAAAGVSNLEFRWHDALDDGASLGRFDVVLCMGVLHHLSDPAAGMRRLGERLAPDGVVFAYVYGTRGSRERLRRKELLTLLAGSGAESMEHRIGLARAMGFGANDFGWNVNADDTASADALLVDSYANARETTFDTDGLLALLGAGGVDGFLTYGVTCGAQGLLFDTGLDAPSLPLPWTDLTTHLPGERLRAAYESMPLRDKYRLVELAYEPNGFTVLGYHAGAAARLVSVPRIRRNAFHAR